MVANKISRFIRHTCADSGLSLHFISKFFPESAIVITPGIIQSGYDTNTALQLCTNERGNQTIMSKAKRKLTLSQPATYQIKVPGEIDVSWSVWAEKMTITVESEDEGPPTTTLTCIVDQAALHGVLRRLYSFGLPLLSVICVEYEKKSIKK